MKRRLKLYLKRDPAGYYRLLNGRGRYIDTFCGDTFHKVTGFKLLRGENKQIKITITEVK